MRDYFSSLGESAHPQSSDPRARAITRFQELLLISFREFAVITDETILSERRRFRSEIIHSIESFSKRSAVRNLKSLERFTKEQAGMIYDALYISLYKLLPTGGQPVVDMPHEDSAMLRDSSDMAPTSTLNELPPMLVDDVLSLPATVGDQSTKGTTTDYVDSIYPLSTAASDGPAKSEHQRQRQVERNKRRRALRHQADLLREQPPKHDCVNPCPSPTCKRILNRFGILDHW